MRVHRSPDRPPPGHTPIRQSLSARLLVLTVIFVMVAEVLIFVPSIARFRVTFLEQKLTEANLAALSLLAAPDQMVSEELERRLLEHVNAAGVVLKLQDRRMLLMADHMPPAIDDTVDLRDAPPAALMVDALMALFEPMPRMLRVIGHGRDGTTVEVLMDESHLKTALQAYSRNILSLSLVISVIVAGLLFLSLRWLMVRPMRQLTESMMAFRADPEAARLPELPRQRRDEIGVAANELAAMEADLRQALVQKSHLAALGTAVSKINHDLRNILSTAQIVSETLSDAQDPVVQRMAPRLLRALDRAIALCTSSLRYGSAEEAAPEIARHDLNVLVEECREALDLGHGNTIQIVNLVPAGFMVLADREQLFRVLMNLGRNAAQAVADQTSGRVEIHAGVMRTANGEDRIEIRVRDNGGGVPEKARESLFKPFLGSVRDGGTGLGLAIARDLILAHGGTIALERTGPAGTVFLITLPVG